MNRRTLIRALTLAAATAPLTRLPAFAEGAPIKMRDLYNKDLSFSDLALSNEGKRVAISGFMAPPLKAESVFFVLTKKPMAVCPFCEPGMPWPDDILAIYARRVVKVIGFNIPIVTEGTLELGDHVDPDLGFASKVRLVDATYARA